MSLLVLKRAAIAFLTWTWCPHSRWEAAVGNLEDARVAFDVIARAVDDAVFLDEDAYKQIMPTMQYTVKIQVCLAVADWLFIRVQCVLCIVLILFMTHMAQGYVS